MTSGEVRREALNEAIAAFGGALEIYTEEDFPRQWRAATRALDALLAFQKSNSN